MALGSIKLQTYENDPNFVSPNAQWRVFKRKRSLEPGENGAAAVHARAEAGGAGAVAADEGVGDAESYGAGHCQGATIGQTFQPDFGENHVGTFHGKSMHEPPPEPPPTPPTPTTTTTISW